MLIKGDASPNFIDNTGTTLTIYFSSDYCQFGYIVSETINHFAGDVSNAGPILITTVKWTQSDPRCPPIKY
jgi:hypothetical protein